MPLSRDCMLGYHVCPGAFVPGAAATTGNISANASRTATTRIPANITAMFTSATNGTTLASIFDIQYRSWIPYTSSYFDNRQPYPKGQLFHIDYLLSSERPAVLEGVVADMRSGGIGYRNHTAPVGPLQGAEWEEDLLWIEPEISCQNTNLSLQLTLADLGRMDRSTRAWAPVRNMSVIDDGGLAYMPRGNPTDDWPAINYTSPDVALRARRTAWLSNFLTALALNVSAGRAAQYGLNVTLGRHYKLPLDPTDIQRDVMCVHADGGVSGDWLNVPFATFNKNGSLSTLNNTLIENPEEDPYMFAAGMFGELGRRCTGALSDTAGSVDTNVQCAHLFGTPSRIDNGPPLLQDPGSQWQVPIHVCAGAVKASVKTVTFFTNGSSTSLTSLSVRDIKEKSYANPEAYPLWAMEDKWHAGSEGASPAPLWGIVKDNYRGTPGYNFSKAAAFYVPSSWTASSWDVKEGPLDILAGSATPYATLVDVLGTLFAGSRDNVPRYSGRDNIALQNRWRTLSRQPGGPELLLRLVWTDLMASTTVGAVLREEGTGSSTGDPATRRKVTIYSRRITYDMRYAVPAMLFAFSWLSLLLVGLVKLLVDRRSPTHLKHLLNQTSLGRVAVGDSHAEREGLMRAPTGMWINMVGHVPVRLGVGPASPTGAETPSAENGDEDTQSGTAMLPIAGKPREDALPETRD
ncbi:mandelate racemase/muconate lactonizing enzyme family protein [Purpureocillium lavendulum]|uniref:Mandelate racemase/muconate lactonizing enzyme family protein n=1 Tax=Purpureocillium lavendulum TaxID=1247861 RepID=A0AB34FEG8_9HYPO|nr:mandelate racemase/muconate lactonizing enzyme family protein [Purpureocillium lavendulum]